MIKKAMILAAGFGKRVQPLTLTKPKPLLEIGTETLLFKSLNFLKLFGIQEVTINVHYLAEQIINYINKNNFKINIKIINEKKEILDTGGGIKNAISSFAEEPIIILNPDTLWGKQYLNELKLLEDFFIKNKSNLCSLLVVNKKKSFDNSFKGDFNLNNQILSRKNKDDHQYIYTGIQIINPRIFDNIKENVFSMNKVWDQLIIKNQLFGIESKEDFYHVSTFNIYKNLAEKFSS